MATVEHCGCCVRHQGFGPRRLRAFLLLVKHPELDEPTFRGMLLAETDRNGQLRGEVQPERKLPLVEPGEAA